IAVTMKFPAATGVKIRELNDIAELRSVVMELADSRKISLIRLDFNGWRFWFDPGDLYTEPPLPHKKRRQTKIAVHISDKGNFALLGAFISRTASRWLSSKASRDALDALWKDREEILSNEL